MKYARFPRFTRATVGKLVPILFRTRILGVENIPAGGALLAGNHVSYLDPILMWCTSPRPVHFMAKKELWENKVIATVLPRFWGFPVSRGEPDRTAITTATDLLKAGELVGVFPEGGRSEDGGEELRAAQGGAAFIALRADAPVVPVAFVGTERAWPKGAKLPRLVRTYISIGRPVLPSGVMPEGGRKERVAALTSLVMERIAEELESARRAVS